MKRFVRMGTTLALGVVLGTPAALSAPPAYSDDRSTPEALVQSLYNAINRKEYLRAWSYFQPGATPAYTAFKAGYADTASVEVKLGKASAEGATGSVQTRLPVTIRAHQSDGTSTVFAGCYTLVQVDPSVQDAPPFRPIQIAMAHLQASTSGFDNAAPTCK